MGMMTRCCRRRPRRRKRRRPPCKSPWKTFGISAFGHWRASSRKVGLLSCYDVGRSNGTTGGAWAELDDKLAVFGVDWLRSLAKGAEPEALSRVVIDRILIDACQQPGAILSLEERLGTEADVERGERDFPTGVCDYVLRRRPDGEDHCHR